MVLRSLGPSLLALTLSLSALGCAVDDAAMVDAAPAERSALASGKHQPGPPAFTTKKIGSPAWEPVDFHQVAVDLGPYAPAYTLGMQSLVLPSPDHVWNDALGIAPGAAHPPPYDDELEHNLAAVGLESRSMFSQAEFTWPNAILGIWMVVPSAGAPTGSSPDFEQGPIIPHTICPIHADTELYIQGASNPVYAGSFDVVALDTIVPPIHVDGHSHFPVFTWVAYEQPGHHFWKLTLLDQAGDGWEVKQRFVVKQP